MTALVFIDVETGGLNPHTRSLLEIGMVAITRHPVDGSMLLNDFSSYVREETISVEPEALAVNGIDLCKLQHAPSPSEVLTQIDQWLWQIYRPTSEITAIGLPRPSGSEPIKVCLAGWNLKLDRAFFDRLLGLSVGTFCRFTLHHRMIDVASVVNSPRLWRAEAPLGLDEALTYYGIDMAARGYCNGAGRHSALFDAYAAFEIWASHEGSQQ